MRNFAVGRGRLRGDRPLPPPPLLRWDGEYDSDPLTFYLGENLETGGRQTLTLSSEASHILVSGEHGSGKTLFTGVIAAQCLIKPMPWDPDLHGVVVVVDMLREAEEVWTGRTGVAAASGWWRRNSPEALISLLDQVEAEYQRRALVLAQHEGVKDWLDLPDRVKSKEGLAPMIVILDEHDPHAVVRRSKHHHIGEAITVLANQLARKGHSVGIHLVIIPWESESWLLTNASLMEHLPVRVMMGEGSDPTTCAMFGGRTLPDLFTDRDLVAPLTDVSSTGATFRKRARVMTGADQGIDVVQTLMIDDQIYDKCDNLDKWLPREEIPPNFNLPSARRSR